MVLISKGFSESFHFLAENKKVILPVFISMAVPLLLIIVFMHISGLQPLLAELGTHSREFAQIKEGYLLDPANFKEQGYGQELVTYLDEDKYSEAFNVYLEQKGYSYSKFVGLITTQNILMGATFFVFGMLVALYFSCMAYSMISRGLRKKGLAAGEVISETNSYLLRLLTMELLLGIIVLFPIALGIFVVSIVFFVSIIAGFLSLVILLFLALAYIFFVSMRLFFVIPSMYMNSSGPINSIRHSHTLTKGHTKQVLMVFLIIYGASLFITSTLSDPLFNSVSGYLLESNFIRMTFLLLIIFFLVLVESAVFTLEHIFLFKSYVDLEELEKRVP